jgi:hypothetical protein
MIDSELPMSALGFNIGRQIHWSDADNHQLRR